MMFCLVGIANRCRPSEKPGFGITESQRFVALLMFNALSGIVNVGHKNSGCANRAAAHNSSQINQRQTQSHGPALKLQAVVIHACISVSGHNNTVMLRKYHCVFDNKSVLLLLQMNILRGRCLYLNCI